MASEYLKKLAREQPPQEPKRELTPAEKRRNWLDYHKWWLAAGALLVWIAASILWNALGIGRVKPDFIFAYVGDKALDGGIAAAFETKAAALALDKNGDGRVRVELRQYISPGSGDLETAFYYDYAVSVQLLADIEKKESAFFLTGDPAGLQRTHQILANADGSAPEDKDDSIEGKVYAWNDCPGLRGMELDPSAVSRLYLGRRFFLDEDGTGREAEEALWQALTKGEAR